MSSDRVDFSSDLFSALVSFTCEWPHCAIIPSLCLRGMGFDSLFESSPGFAQTLCTQWVWRVSKVEGGKKKDK